MTSAQLLKGLMYNGNIQSEEPPVDGSWHVGAPVFWKEP